MKRKNSIAAQIAAIVGAALGGIISIFSIPLSEMGFDTMQTGLLRMFMSTAEMFIYIIFCNRKLLKIDLKDWWMFFCCGAISLVLMTALYLFTITNGEKAIAGVLLYTSPAFVIVMSAVLFREKITMRKVIAFMFTITGCIFVSGIGGSSSVKPLIFATGMGAALAYSLYQIFSSIAVRKYNPITVTAYSLLCGTLGFLVLSDIKDMADLIVSQPVSLVYGLGMSLLSTVLSYILLTWAFKHTETGRVSILATSEMVIGAIVGIVVFNEPFRMEILVGMLLVMTSVIVLNAKIKADLEENKYVRRKERTY